MKNAETILVIEDEQYWFNLLEEPCKNFNIVKADEYNCIDKIKKKSYDIIILDIMLGEETGTSIFELIE